MEKIDLLYILEANEYCMFICGIQLGLNIEKFSRIVEDISIGKYLRKVSTKKVYMIYITFGRLHAIEDGLKLIGIQ